MTTYRGQRMTKSTALQASWEDFLTSYSTISATEALDYANEGFGENARIASENGWEWPCEADADDLREPFRLAHQELRRQADIASRS